jgi:hypothetical protein
MVPGQDLIVTGQVTNFATGAPIAGASVSAETFKHFDYTDQQGNYYLELPPGRYRVTVRHVGMKTRYVRLLILSQDVFSLAMQEGTTDLDEVVITSRALDSNVKQSLTGLTTLNVQEIKTLPTLMGEVDIMKSLQLMPGVSSVGEGSSGFNVRGGRMDQNLILLNDVPLFNNSHALGFVSAFNQDILKNFSLYKGNVPANFGGRASSVLEISTRHGDEEKWRYQGGVGPITSRFLAEGPIAKSRTSLMMSGRVSHANWAVRRVSDPAVRDSRLSFFDLYGGIHHKITDASTVDFSVYSSQDEFRYAQQFGYSWNNTIVNGKWIALSDRKASPSLSVSYGHYRSTLIDPNGADASELTNTLNYLQIGEQVNYTPNEQHNVHAGISAIGYFPKPEELTGYRGNTNVRDRSADKNRGIEFALYANDDIKLSDKFGLSVGLRYSHYNHIGEDTVFHYEDGHSRRTENITDTTYYGAFEKVTSFGGLEPRISARYNLSDEQSIKVSYNRMRQYIHLISNTTAPTPVDLWQVSNDYLPPQIADNYSIGYFQNFKDNQWETSAELFYKDMKNLVEYKDFAELYLNDHLETELLTGIGRAYGTELYIRRLKGRWTGWISYTYALTEVQVKPMDGNESINDGEWYPSNYNKPHTFNLVIDRRMLNGGAFSVIFTYNSGRPLTAIESSYIVGGTVVPLYSDRNKYRIPDYFRVDVSFTIGSILKKIDDSLVFSIYNLLGRENAYSVYYQRPAPNFFIPKAYRLSVLGNALPSLTYNFKF